MDEVIARILEGTDGNEHPADAVHLCFAVLVAEMAPGNWGELRGRAWTRETSRIVVETMAGRLHMIGKILCLIFTPVKPREYVEQMTAARLQFAGIAGNPELQGEYAALVSRLVADGAFRSVEAAIERELYRELALQMRGYAY